MQISGQHSALGLESNEEWPGSRETDREGDTSKPEIIPKDKYRASNNCMYMYCLGRSLHRDFAVAFFSQTLPWVVVIGGQREIKYP